MRTEGNFHLNVRFHEPFIDYSARKVYIDGEFADDLNLLEKEGAENFRLINRHNEAHHAEECVDNFHLGEESRTRALASAKSIQVETNEKMRKTFQRPGH